MRTLLVSDCPAHPLTSRLTDVLRARVDLRGTAPPAELAERLPAVEPELLVVVLSHGPAAGLQAIRKARALTPAYVVAVGPASDAELIMRALQEGADHYLAEADVEKGLDAALSRWQSRSGVTRVSARLVAVLSAAGGSGASTLAVNIAAVLARDHGKCGLVDLKPGKGDLAALLDLHPPFHLVHLCQNVTRLDRAMFEKVLAPHPSGIHLLASPQLYTDTRLVTAQGVGEALSLARRLFPFVVADLEDCFHEEQLVALRQADVVLLVSRPDLAALCSARRILDHLDGAGVGRSAVRLAINRQGLPNELPAQEAEEALGGRRAFYVPDDPRAVNGANNTGVPVVLKAPAAKVSQAIDRLTKGLLGRRRSDDSPSLPAELASR